MIVFVDLRQAEIVGHRFTFWNTVSNQFIIFQDEQAWDTWEHFVEAVGNLLWVDLPRFKKLTPKWAFRREEKA